MIKYECNNGEIRVETNGNLPELLADYLMLGKLIYDRIVETCSEEAEMFKATVSQVSRNDFDIEKSNNEALEELAKRIDENTFNLISKIVNEVVDEGE